MEAKMTDITYKLSDIKFEWDEEKADANLTKHNITFEFACESFFDPLLKVEEAGIIEGEQREAIIGLTVDWRLLYVVYTMREEDEIVRIISARKATEEERKHYENE